MATKLFLVGSGSNANYDWWSSGAQDVNDNATAVGWFDNPVRMIHGAGFVTNTATTAGSETWYVETTSGGDAIQWVSPPLAHDVTISGTITFNLWWAESAMTQNAGAGCIVKRIRGSDGTVQGTVVRSAKGTEMPLTTPTAQNWTAGATSTSFLKGDRIAIVPAATNVGTMGAGTASFYYAGTTDGNTGDSYVTFAEDIAFITTDPGTDPTQAAGGASGVFGDLSSEISRAAFFCWNGGVLSSVEMYMRRVGSPADSVTCAIQADSGGAPSGTDLVSVDVLGSTLSTGDSYIMFDLPDTVLSPGKYWIVMRRTGALNGSERYSLNLSQTDAHFETWSANLSTSTWIIAREQYHPYKLHGAGLTGTTTQPTNVAISTAIQTGILNGASGLFGGTGSNEAFGQSFTVPVDLVLSGASVGYEKIASPTDNVTLELRSAIDGSALATSNAVDMSTLGSGGNINFVFPTPYSLVANTTYYVVLQRSGARDTVNYIGWYSQTAGYANGAGYIKSNGSWSAQSADFTFEIPNPWPLELWTSGGSTSSSTMDTVAGWTPPVLRRSSATGYELQWYTRPLEAFTLSGAVLCNLNASATTGASAAHRAEIAVVNRNGGSPVVWGTGAYPDAIVTTNTTQSFFVSGDDLAVTDGQRIRLRVFIDDRSTAEMISAHTSTFNYGTGGNTSVVFSQILEELIVGGHIVPFSPVPFVQAISHKSPI